MINLDEISIHSWIISNQIKTETGQPIDFKTHPFLFHPYTDESPRLVIFKAAQIGFSTLAILKSLWIAKNRGLDIIYTLPTESDVHQFVGGKVNRIIAQNPILQQWVKEKDSVEQKSVGENLIYYRGTWTQKAAIMVSSDLNIYDEVDASKQDVVEQYSTRLQHSPYKWEWYFSHPSAQGTGVDRYWGRSDQKHWFIRCEACNRRQYLSWPQSIDQHTAQYICKSCHKPISDRQRKLGEWVQKYKERDFSGYWIPLLICPWVSAGEVVAYNKDKSEEYFYNKVLGLPYVGGGNKLTRQALIQNLTEENLYPDKNERVVIGLDTGTQLYYVLGGEKGLFHYGIAKDYDEIEGFLKRWPRAVCVCDQGGDLIGSRKLQASFPGRVYLCTFKDNDVSDNPKWGDNDERGTVQVGRNKFIQLVVDEFTDKRIPIMGKEIDWDEYYIHWNNLTRVKEIDDKTGLIKRKIWVKNGQSDFPFSTVYWRVGMTRFANRGEILQATETNVLPISHEIQPDNTVQFDPIKLMKDQQRNNGDWRNM